MRERAVLAGGELDIHSVQGHGTRIHARFPLHEPSPAQDIPVMATLA